MKYLRHKTTWSAFVAKTRPKIYLDFLAANTGLFKMLFRAIILISIFHIEAKKYFVPWQCPDGKEIYIPQNLNGWKFQNFIRNNCSFDFDCRKLKRSQRNLKVFPIFKTLKLKESRKNIQYAFERGFCSTRILRSYADRNYLPACRTHDACQGLLTSL